MYSPRRGLPVPTLELSVDELDLLGLLLGYYIDYLAPNVGGEDVTKPEMERQRAVGICLFEKMVLLCSMDFGTLDVTPAPGTGVTVSGG
jgi:hypothetical protein